MFDDPHSDKEVRAYREGYDRGEAERIALATANSELRTDNRELRSALKEALRLTGDFTDLTKQTSEIA